MIEIKVDYDRCDANGTCAALMPDVFEIGADGLLHQLVDTVGDERSDELEEAILCCPVGAISRVDRAESAGGTDQALPHFDLFHTDAMEHAGGPLPDGALATGPDGYSVLGFDLASNVLRDRRFRNSALHLMEEFGIIDGPVHSFRAQSIIMQEGQQHLRLRTPLARFMSPVTVQKIRGVLRDMVSTIMQEADSTTPVNFHDDVDRRLPSLVYCHLAGAPESDAPKVQRLSERTLALLARDRSLVPDIKDAYDELFAYLGDLIALKRAEGLGDDMLSHLIAMADEGKLTDDELLVEATSMLEASSVNTAHQTGLVVWTLLLHRDVWDRIVADPAKIPQAVVEALRLYPRTGVVSKIASEDIELDGHLIPQGSDVHVAVWSANRDPQHFDRASEFDIDRARNQPLTFSTGPHNCLGQGLAKVEMEEVVRYLAENHPRAKVVEDQTRIGQVAGRWHIGSLVIELEP